MQPAANTHEDPFPTRIDPMFAVLADKLPARSQQWAFEYKWDGVRAILYHQSGQVRLLSRNAINMTHQYPELEALGTQLQHPTILDGEIVAIDASGRPSFSLLQRRMHVADRRTAMTRTKQVFVMYMIFDVLYHGSTLLLNTPYRDRREQLEAMALEGANWRVPPSYPQHGRDVLQAARNMGLEGIIAKQQHSPYLPGQRSDLWLKIKIRPRQEFVIGGWTPLRGQAGGTLGAMLLGYYEDDALRYAGNVGTGFSEQDRRTLKRLLEAHGLEQSPFTDPVPRTARFVEPRFVAEIEFSEWTPAGSLRQPSFKGLRLDKDPRKVVRE